MPDGVLDGKRYYAPAKRGTRKSARNCMGMTICLCERADSTNLYRGLRARRKVRFGYASARVRYEVSQRLEKTETGWRTVGSFEHTSPVRLKR